jgi:ParB/RepB/Spo0J family partition protein
MDKLAFIPISKIKVSERTRTEFGDMEGLIESVKDKGIIQPITVSPKHGLLAGERRYRAAKAAGLKEIPCIIRHSNAPIDALEVELIENLFREDFSFSERALHIKKLHDHCAAKNIDWSGRKLAKLLNRNAMSVARDLKIANTLEVFPELSKAGTQDEALRTIKRMEEGVIVQELRRRQEASTNRGKKDMVDIAKHNYNIGDTFKGMAELKSNGMVHFIELDPPYAIDLVRAKGGASQRAAGRDDDPKVASYNEIPADKYAAFMQRMASETYRIAWPFAWMICWFGSTHFELVKSALKKAKWIVNDIPGIWVKPGGQTAAPEYNLANCYESFFICRKGSPPLMKRGRSNVFEFTPTPPAQKYHPTERPMELIQELLATFTMPGQICFVPCLGSGATLRACYLSGVRGFGYDLSGEYKDRFLLAVEEDMRQLDKE